MSFTGNLFPQAGHLSLPVRWMSKILACMIDVAITFPFKCTPTRMILPRSSKILSPISRRYLRALTLEKIRKFSRVPWPRRCTGGSRVMYLKKEACHCWPTDRFTGMPFWQFPYKIPIMHGMHGNQGAYLDPSQQDRVQACNESISITIHVQHLHERCHGILHGWSKASESSIWKARTYRDIRFRGIHSWNRKEGKKWHDHHSGADGKVFRKEDKDIDRS